jgi:hypothetical protein
MTDKKYAQWWDRLSIIEKYKYMDSIGIGHLPIDTVSLEQVQKMYGTSLDH